MDFKVTDASRAKLRAMLHDFDKIVLASGGGFICKE